MEMENEIDFKGDNPGAVRFGNFINYYQFHPAENRIKLFPKNIWKNNTDKQYVCLDIGCNAGDLTVSLIDFFKQNVCNNKTNCYFLGIDVDPTLIKRAKEIENSNFIEFECIDFMNDNQTITISKYLQKHNKSTFNVSFCLSITMWIHLNHGDSGLRTFLKKVCEFSDLVVVEPQPWKCYKTAVKRLKQVNAEFPLFSQLKHRQDVENFIENILEEDCKFDKVAETPPTNWGRRILFYERKRDVNNFSGQI